MSSPTMELRVHRFRMASLEAGRDSCCVGVVVVTVVCVLCVCECAPCGYCVSHFYGICADTDVYCVVIDYIRGDGTYRHNSYPQQHRVTLYTSSSTPLFSLSLSPCSDCILVSFCLFVMVTHIRPTVPNSANCESKWRLCDSVQMCAL